MTPFWKQVLVCMSVMNLYHLYHLKKRIGCWKHIEINLISIMRIYSLMLFDKSWRKIKVCWFFFHKMMQHKGKKGWWNSFSLNLWEFMRIGKMTSKRKPLRRKGPKSILHCTDMRSGCRVYFANFNEQLIGFSPRKGKASRCKRVLGKFRYDTWLAVLLWVGIMKSFGTFKTKRNK